LYLEDRGITVEGRVVKYHNDNKYYWEISHHWKGKETSGIYYPSKISASSPNESYDLLSTYMSGFPGSVEVVPNDDY